MGGIYDHFPTKSPYIYLFVITNSSPNIDTHLGYLVHRYGKDIPNSTQLIVSQVWTE